MGWQKGSLYCLKGVGKSTETSVEVSKHFLSVRMSTKGHFGYYSYRGSAGFLTVGRQLCKPKKLVNRKVTGVREINNKTKTKN